MPTALTTAVPSTVGSSIYAPDPEIHNGLVVVVIICIAYTVFGLVTFALVSKCRLVSLPDWYKTSDRGSKEKILVGLWFPGIFVFWPFILPPWLMARCGFRSCETLGSMLEKVKGRVSDTDGSGDHRDSVELERWVDVPLNEAGQTAVPEGGRIQGAAVNGYEEGQPTTLSADEAVVGTLPNNNNTNGSAADQSMRRIVWWEKYPLPPILANSSGGGDKSTSKNGNPYPCDNGSGQQADTDKMTPGSDPVGKTMSLRRLQTIPETPEEWEGLDLH